jgi:hypothetical protein
MNQAPHVQHFNTGLGFALGPLPNTNTNTNTNLDVDGPRSNFNFDDKFHFPQSKERYAYNIKWKELETYLNKFYGVQLGLCGSYQFSNSTARKIIDFDKHLVCYIRMDFGLKETRIYTTHEKIPSIFADYITLNYCDEFVLMWIISWFGYDSWDKYINYCKKYSVFLEELVCLGVSFNIEEGCMQIIYMDGNDKNSVRRVKLPWNKEAYGFVIDQQSHSQSQSQSQLNEHAQSQFQSNCDQQQQQQQQQRRFVKLKFKSSSLNQTKQIVNVL